MTTVFLSGITMKVEHCISCGIPFTVPQNVYEKHLEEGGFHYCPNGHGQGWDKSRSKRAAEEREREELRRERDRLAQQVAQKEDEVIAEIHLRHEAEKKLAKVEKRIKAGVCPCCNRHFANLERHMASKHKEAT